MLMDISEATGRAMHRSDKSLFVGCMPAFAMKRLLPNLKDFCGKHPDISVRFWTVLTSNSFSRRDYDVAILYGAGDWPGCVARKISDEEIFPVCSPMLLRRQPRLRKPQDPQQHTAIRTAYSFILQDDWPLWLDAAGEKNLQFANEITFDLLLPALQAANDGLGVALGRSPLVSSDLAARRLVEPFSIRIRSKSAFYIVSPQDRDVLPNVRLFRNWALNRLGSHALQTAAGSLRPLRERLLRLGGDADHC